MRWLFLVAIIVLVVAPAASAGSTNPCVLVTSADAAKVIGGKPVAKPQTLGLYKSCTYKTGRKTITVLFRKLAKADFEKSAKKNPPPFIAHVVPDSLAIFWDIGIEIDETGNLLLYRIRDTRNDHSSIGVAAQHDLI